MIQALTLALLLAAPAFEGVAPIDGIAAIVDDALIFRSEVIARARPQLTQHADAGPAEREALEREVLAQMIEEALIAADAARLHIAVTEAELAGALAMVRDMNGIDSAGLEAQIRRAGMSYEEYEAQLRSYLLEQKWLISHTEAMDPYLFPDEASHTAAYAAQRRILVEALRSRAFIEVR
ncbi:SurA N-terminal domain-containing protein [Nannocystis sp.]|uniref:SurA N-terminal domain-containing protein n=1 Tax=Nannocystis sp. TaxID=1962667 RepID=UPI002428D77C|nr:SurA N-terminal domain-containing protein [Nannocystis sp.]MBK7828114.1 SurA N-terminal domain-containing protein [Nannocystis sp.]MBK9753551.1 SurA N-terminal domain-containing protein [Nannocystis sp.]